MASDFENIRAVKRELFNNSRMASTDSTLGDFTAIENAIDDLLFAGEITPKDIAVVYRYISHFETNGQLNSMSLSRFREGVMAPEIVELIAPLGVALRITCKTIRDMYAYACAIKNGYYERLLKEWREVL